MPSHRQYPITTATGIGAASSSSLLARSSSITGFAANKSMAHLNAHGQRGGGGVLSPGVCLTYDAGACVFRQLHYRLLIHWISVDNGNKALPPASSFLPPTAPAEATSVAAHKFVHKLTQSEREGQGEGEIGRGRGREVERERNRQRAREAEAVRHPGRVQLNCSS